MFPAFGEACDCEEIFVHGRLAATSVASERVFSTSGNIISSRRNKLTAENVDMLTCNCCLCQIVGSETVGLQ